MDILLPASFKNAVHHEQLVKAADAYRQATNARPDWAESFYNLGNTLEELEDFDGALQAYDRALQINPAFAQAHVNKGVVLAKTGFDNRARQAWKQALKSKIPTIDCDYIRSAAYANLGKIRQARHYYYQASSQQPTLAPKYHCLAQCLDHYSTAPRTLFSLRTLTEKLSQNHTGITQNLLCDLTTEKLWPMLKPQTTLVAAGAMLAGIVAYTTIDTTQASPTNPTAPAPPQSDLTPLAQQTDSDADWLLAHEYDHYHSSPVPAPAIAHHDSTPETTLPYSPLALYSGLFGSASPPNAWNPGSYNIQVGPVSIDLSAQSRLSYDNNINFSDTNEKDDFILYGGMNIDAKYPITELNTLSLKLDLGYNKYFDNSNLDSSTLLVSPDTALSVDIFIKDFTITLYDNFSYQESPFEENLNNISRFRRFTNALGTNIVWNGGSIQPKVGYELYNYWMNDDAQFDFLDRTEHRFTSSIPYTHNDWLKYGIYADYTYTNYHDPDRGNANKFSFGPNFDMSFGQSLSLSGNIGYTHFDTEHGTTRRGNTTDGISMSITAKHQLSDAIQHSLTLSRSHSIAVNASTSTILAANYNLGWLVNDRLSLNGGLYAQDGEEGSNAEGYYEEYQRAGITFGANYILSPKLRLNFNVDHSRKDSERSGNDYTRTLTSIGLEYDF